MTERASCVAASNCTARDNLVILVIFVWIYYLQCYNFLLFVALCPCCLVTTVTNIVASIVRYMSSISAMLTPNLLPNRPHHQSSTLLVRFSPLSNHNFVLALDFVFDLSLTRSLRLTSGSTCINLGVKVLASFSYIIRTTLAESTLREEHRPTSSFHNPRLHPVSVKLRSLLHINHSTSCHSHQYCFDYLQRLLRMRLHFTIHPRHQ